MKKTLPLLTLTLVLFLTACAPTLQSSLPPSSSTTPPISTPSPTPSPTPMPTVTPVPTPTLDPNKWDGYKDGDLHYYQPQKDGSIVTHNVGSIKVPEDWVELDENLFGFEYTTGANGERVYTEDQLSKYNGAVEMNIYVGSRSKDYYLHHEFEGGEGYESPILDGFIASYKSYVTRPTGFEPDLDRSLLETYEMYRVAAPYEGAQYNIYHYDCNNQLVEVSLLVYEMDSRFDPNIEIDKSGISLGKNRLIDLSTEIKNFDIYNSAEHLADRLEGSVTVPASWSIIEGHEFGYPHNRFGTSGEFVFTEFERDESYGVLSVEIFFDHARYHSQAGGGFTAYDNFDKNEDTIGDYFLSAYKDLPKKEILHNDKVITQYFHVAYIKSQGSLPDDEKIYVYHYFFEIDEELVYVRSSTLGSDNPKAEALLLEIIDSIKMANQ